MDSGYLISDDRQKNPGKTRSPRFVFPADPGRIRVGTALSCRGQPAGPCLVENFPVAHLVLPKIVQKTLPAVGVRQEKAWPSRTVLPVVRQIAAATCNANGMDLLRERVVNSKVPVSCAIVTTTEQAARRTEGNMRQAAAVGLRANKCAAHKHQRQCQSKDQFLIHLSLLRYRIVILLNPTTP